MKKIYGLILVLVISFVIPFQILAQPATGVPINTQSLIRETPWNKFTDNLATAGKPSMEKARILDERKEARRVARLRAVQKKRQQAMFKRQKYEEKLNSQFKSPNL